MLKLAQRLKTGICVSILAAAIITLCTSKKTEAECGNINGVGAIGQADIHYLQSYLIGGGPAPFDTLTSDVDTYRLITLSDALVILDYIFFGGPPPSCTTTSVAPPPIDSNLVVTIEGFAPSGSTTSEVVIMITNPDYIVSGFCLPIQVALDDASPLTITGGSYSPITEGWLIRGDPWLNIRIDSTDDVVLFIAAWIANESTQYYFLPKGTHEIGRFQVMYAASGEDRNFTCSWKAMHPIQQVTGYDDTALVPLILGSLTSYDFHNKSRGVDFVPPYTPTITSSRIKHGDANGSGSVTIADLTYLVSYLFNNGSAPQSVAGGDVNCNSTITITDLIYLVAYLFNGGSAPCAG
jgi:hypothetical protein